MARMLIYGNPFSITASWETLCRCAWSVLWLHYVYWILKSVPAIFSEFDETPIHRRHRRCFPDLFRRPCGITEIFARYVRWGNSQGSNTSAIDSWTSLKLFPRRSCFFSVLMIWNSFLFMASNPFPIRNKLRYLWKPLSQFVADDIP